VKVRLMALDVVLDQPTVAFFANPEKRDHSRVMVLMR